MYLGVVQLLCLLATMSTVCRVSNAFILRRGTGLTPVSVLRSGQNRLLAGHASVVEHPQSSQSVSYKVGFMFPGQGAQTVGMGATLAEQIPQGSLNTRFTIWFDFYPLS
jgi:hydrogenase/urease accessory protein HupE